MSTNIIYQRDLLFMTEKMELASIHVDILNPNKEGKMHVIIETRTDHSPIDNIDLILKVIQADIFERINIDLKSNVRLFLDVETSTHLKNTFSGSKFVFVNVEDDKINFEGVNEA